MQKERRDLVEAVEDQRVPPNDDGQANRAQAENIVGLEPRKVLFRLRTNSLTLLPDRVKHYSLWLLQLNVLLR